MKYYVHLIGVTHVIEVEATVFNEIREHLANGPDTGGGQRSYNLPIGDDGKKTVSFPLRSVAYIEQVAE
jgi:hypothetical protein